MAPESPQTARIATHQRLHDVDALRGFALLGIFVVNITFMASAYPGNLVDDPSFSSPVDHIARFLVAVLFSMKFYLLFSFLFGYSFVLQMEASRRAGKAFVPRMLRRILGLFLLGVGHIVVLYGGDVLTTYAVVGLILVAMHRVRDVVALRAAGAIYAFVLLSLIMSALFIDRSAFMPEEAQRLIIAAEQTQLLLGGPADVVAHHLSGLDLLVVQAASLQGPTALAMFLLGMVAARRGLFTALSERPRLLRQAQVVGFPVGLGGGIVYALLGADSNTVAVAVSVATAPFLTAAYVSTLVQLMHRAAWIREAFAPVGRMALSNYLAQSVVGVLLFTGVGLGLAGRVSPPLLILTACIVFAGSVVASRWWLRRHRYGPAEHLLRWFTNWSRPSSPRATRPLTR
ncbi:DUF418 domain-containing protein [Nesterenkonia sp. CL21]|uniref:DUF418 domain-containing protein n=1 Tax=Nesterenkonia sp. CL21 TaxID=3064894 RepID=UPI002879117D|nr:DUF418 domain-containing protein [Nesterenkonia sp. CL21]MDS2171866.1 DUF418 domain-containing protein [Nesterenkonia sp. CL21]